MTPTCLQRIQQKRVQCITFLLCKLAKAVTLSAESVTAGDHMGYFKYKCNDVLKIDTQLLAKCQLIKKEKNNTECLYK